MGESFRLMLSDIRVWSVLSSHLQNLCSQLCAHQPSHPGHCLVWQRVGQVDGKNHKIQGYLGSRVGQRKECSGMGMLLIRREKLQRDKGQRWNTWLLSSPHFSSIYCALLLSMLCYAPFAATDASVTGAAFIWHCPGWLCQYLRWLPFWFGALSKHEWTRARLG